MGNQNKINTGNERFIKNSILSRIEELDVNSLNNLESELDDEFVKIINLWYKNYFKTIYNSFFRLGIFKDYEKMEIDLDSLFESLKSNVVKKIVISVKLKTNTINEVIDYLVGVKLGDNSESIKDYNREKLDVQVRELRLERSFSNRIKKCCKFYTK